MKRTIVRKLQIGEISVVDRPAQHGATAVIMKRAPGQFYNVKKVATKETAMSNLSDVIAQDYLEKRAEDELGHLPGTIEEKAALLKAIAEMPDGPRKSMETMLKTADRAGRLYFGGIGKNGTGFTKKIAEIRKRDRCSRTEAMSKAREEFPEEFDEYQSAN